MTEIDSHPMTQDPSGNEEELASKTLFVQSKRDSPWMSNKIDVEDFSPTSEVSAKNYLGLIFEIISMSLLSTWRIIGKKDLIN